RRPRPRRGWRGGGTAGSQAQRSRLNPAPLAPGALLGVALRDADAGSRSDDRRMKHNRDDSQPEVHDVGEASAPEPGARGSAARERAAHERAAGEGQGPGESETAAAGHGIDGSARAAGERETRGDQAPHPDDDGKPDSPTD